MERFRRHWRCVLCVVAMLGFAVGYAWGQAPDASIGAALRSLSQRANAVFVGQVMSITRKGGVVEIVFRVDTPVAGSVSGASYTLREWGGLWTPGMQRYHVGERAMVFAQAASSAGLATPVDGPEGVVPVVLATAGGAPLLDATRLATRVLRTKAMPLSGLAQYVTMDEATALVRNCRERSWKEPRMVPIPTPIVSRSPALTLPDVTLQPRRNFAQEADSLVR